MNEVQKTCPLLCSWLQHCKKRDFSFLILQRWEVECKQSKSTVLARGVFALTSKSSNSLSSSCVYTSNHHQNHLHCNRHLPSQRASQVVWKDLRSGTYKEKREDVVSTRLTCFWEQVGCRSFLPSWLPWKLTSVRTKRVSCCYVQAD